MQRVFGKNFRVVFLGALILNVVMTSSPMRAVISLLPAVTPSPDAETIVFAEPEAVESSVGLVPTSSRDSAFSCLNRALDNPLIFVDCVVVVDNARAGHERHHYVRDNDLDFNIPSLTYRQPSSRHASED
ncbi:hypothetical protein L0337_00765 [candidate division KSB1 bacterium]|nr:hypothetical protein [candidate division KSB1 bacterium]